MYAIKNINGIAKGCGLFDTREEAQEYIDTELGMMDYHKWEVVEVSFYRLNR